MRHFAAAAALLLLAAAPQEKADLKVALKKGDKLPILLRHSMGMRLDKVPELFQGVLSEDLIDLKFEGTVDAEVTSVADGTAVVEGKWKTLKVKGHIAVNDIDFVHDADKKAAASGKKADPADPALQGVSEFQENLVRMARDPVKFTVDRRGTITVEGEKSRGGVFDTVFRSINGLMGPFPEQAVGKGDTWQQTFKLGVEGLSGKVEFPLLVKNAVTSLDGESATIKSDYVVQGTIEPQPGMKIKLDGKGDGTTEVAVKAGRARQSKGAVKIKAVASLPDPNGGDDIALNATLTVDVAHESK